MERKDQRFRSGQFVDCNTSRVVQSRLRTFTPGAALQSYEGFRSTINDVETFLYIILFSVFGLFILLIIGAWLHSRWTEFLEKIVLKRTGRRNSSSTKKTKEQELLPSQFHDVSADLAPIVLAIYDSVKRYKDLSLTNINKHYYFIARSKRYELRITLSPADSKNYFLNAVLEGGHPHEFTVEQSKFRNKSLEISESDIASFLEALSFFSKVVAKPGILSADRTLQLDTSMENWPQVLSAFIRLGRFLMDTEVRQKILEAADVLCPYCRGEFTTKDDTVSCRECNTRHHKECWEEVGRCSVFGCRSKSEIVITQS